jgi:hypothetical protein
MAVITYRPKYWHLLVVAVIAVFDAFVLYMVLNPRVADDYYAYYITRSASCFPRITSGFYPYGEPVNFVPGRNGYDRDTIRFCGFMPPSTTGIRSFGDYGVIRFSNPPPPGDLLLTFSSWANTDASKPRREVQVVVNGEQVANLVFATAARVDGRIVIPARVAALDPKGMEIRFNVPRTGPPGTNSEPVTLQLRLEALRVAALDKSPPPPSTPLGGDVPQTKRETGSSPSPRTVVRLAD